MSCLVGVSVRLGLGPTGVWKEVNYFLYSMKHIICQKARFLSVIIKRFNTLGAVFPSQVANGPGDTYIEIRKMYPLRERVQGRRTQSKKGGKGRFF